jgi:MFS family permease
MPEHDHRHLRQGVPLPSRRRHCSGARRPCFPGEIAIGVIIGRTSEFFDFFVYAIASVLVFPKLLFPFTDAFTGTIYSFAIFPLAFIARPVGSFVFMMIDLAYGRTAKLVVALFMLGGSTASIAFLPGYADMGSGAIALLALFRLGQGFALGGSWDGLASLLALNAPKEHRGWYAMIPQLGAPLGLIVASSMFAFFLSTLPQVEFVSWGWRFPSSWPLPSMWSRCLPACVWSAPPSSNACSKAAIWLPNRRSRRCAASGRRSCWAPLPRWPALRCSIW